MPGRRIERGPDRSRSCAVDGGGRSLCQNALEALGHRGRIEIAVDSNGDEASIAVADDGPGISPGQRPHIFEPFYSARQAGRGVGMGLSKCWRIVTQHGGRIEVGNRAGSGEFSPFVCRLAAANRTNRID